MQLNKETKTENRTVLRLLEFTRAMEVHLTERLSSYKMNTMTPGQVFGD